MEASNKPPVKIRAEILKIPAYKQGATPTKQGFKLSSNENPFETPHQVIEAVANASVNRYAGVAMPQLRAEIGKLFGISAVDSADRVHLAAGSVNILYQLIQAVAGPGDQYVYAWPSFEGYPLLGIASGAQAVVVGVDASARHDLLAMAAAVNEKTRAVLLCSPNNPTGTVIKKAEFAEFMRAVPNDVLVVLDEAYREFVTDPEAVQGEEELEKYPNLVVLRTFSKAYGLAALRIGYGVGVPEIWNAAKVTAVPLSVTGQAEAAARAALSGEVLPVLERQITALNGRRERLVAGLKGLGFNVAEAQGNFVWLPLGAEAADLANLFAAEGTLVRPFIGEGVRISVGEEESIAEVLRIAKLFLEGVRAA